MDSLYTVFDNVARVTSGRVIQEKNDNTASRLFYDALKAKESGMAEHAADYDLIRIGVISDTGYIIPEPDGPVVVATGHQFKIAMESDK